MTMVRIYHNPRCQKSREALKLLKKHEEKIEIVEYLKNPPSIAELSALATKMKMKPEDLVRKKEPLYKNKYRERTFSDREWIKIMVNNPVLIERPIVVRNRRVILARPPQRVNDLYD